MTLESDQREVILETIRRVQPDFLPKIEAPFMGYTCPLLTHLNNETPVSALFDITWWQIVPSQS